MHDDSFSDGRVNDERNQRWSCPDCAAFLASFDGRGNEDMLDDLDRRRQRAVREAELERQYQEDIATVRSWAQVDRAWRQYRLARRVA